MLITAVHPVVRKFNLNIEILRQCVNNTQLDVTVTNDVAILVNKVNTYQRLTVNSLTGSGLIKDSLTVSSYRTSNEYTRGLVTLLLDVLRLTSYVSTDNVVNSLELVVQSQSLEHSVSHHLVSEAGTILSKAQIREVGLNEGLQVDTVRIIVEHGVSSGHRNSTSAVDIIAACVTNALIEVIRADVTIVTGRTYEGVLVKVRIRSLVCKSNDVNQSGNNNSIVRSNGGVVELHLSSDERQGLRLIIIVITSNGSSTMSCCIISQTSVVCKMPPIGIIVPSSRINSAIQRLCISPSPEHIPKSILVNIERNSQDTTLELVLRTTL